MIFHNKFKLDNNISIELDDLKHQVSSIYLISHKLFDVFDNNQIKIYFIKWLLIFNVEKFDAQI